MRCSNWCFKRVLVVRDNVTLRVYEVHDNDLKEIGNFFNFEKLSVRNTKNTGVFFIQRFFIVAKL